MIERDAVRARRLVEHYAPCSSAGSTSNAEKWPHRYARAPVRWVRHKAILVESVCIDGKPRQKHVAFVDSYVQGETPEEIEHAHPLRRDARKRLDQLGNRTAMALLRT